MTGAAGTGRVLSDRLTPQPTMSEPNWSPSDRLPFSMSMAAFRSEALARLPATALGRAISDHATKRIPDGTNGPVDGGIRSGVVHALRSHPLGHHVPVLLRGAQGEGGIVAAVDVVWHRPGLTGHSDRRSNHGLGHPCLELVIRAQLRV